MSIATQPATNPGNGSVEEGWRSMQRLRKFPYANWHDQQLGFRSHTHRNPHLQSDGWHGLLE